MTRRPGLAERRCCLEATLDTDWQRSTRYWGAWLCRQLNTMRPSLNATSSGTLSQCSSVCKSRDKPRWNLCVPLTTQAAAFSTRCSLSVVSSANDCTARLTVVEVVRNNVELGSSAPRNSPFRGCYVKLPTDRRTAKQTLNKFHRSQ